MVKINNTQLDGILEKFKNSNHPELTHYHKGNHPGNNWFLKTVCPMSNLEQIDRLGYGSIWKRLSKKYPETIKIKPEAYDWDGNEIPYMISVWVINDTDIIFNHTDINEQLEIIFVHRASGQQLQLDKLNIITSIEKEKIIENIDLTSNKHTDYIMELDKIKEIIGLLQKSLLKSNKIGEIKKFKIIKGGKNGDD